MFVFGQDGVRETELILSITASFQPGKPMRPKSQAEKFLLDEKIAKLISALEVTKSAYQGKREAAREAEVAARKAKRELSSFEATRWVLLKDTASCMLLDYVDSDKKKMLIMCNEAVGVDRLSSLASLRHISFPSVPARV